MKTPPFFSKQQYRKWQLKKRVQKKSTQLIITGVIALALIIFIILNYK